MLKCAQYQHSITQMMKTDSAITSKWVNIIGGIFVLFGLYITSLYSYLLFHSLAEIFSIAVAYGIFMVAWNSRRFLDNNYLLFLGVAYLFIGGIDLVHTLAYKGMDIFQGYDANLPTQLWISARYLESFTLIIASLVLRRKLNVKYTIWSFSLANVLLLISIFYWKIFPDCFVEGAGLTQFKKVSEYVIALLLMGAIVLLYQRRDEFDRNVFRLLIAALITTISAELAFTFYISVYGFSNLVGHYFKIISFYLIYKAIIETGLVKPYSLLFRNLKQSEETLRESEERFRQLSESAFEAIVIHEKGVLKRANDQFFKTFGYESSELLGKQVLQLLVASESQEFIQKQINTGATTPYESIGLRKDGTRFPMEIRTREIEYQGRPARVGAIIDISERKKMEEALLRAKKLESIGILGGGIAHDFNNILTAIMWNIDIAQSELQSGLNISEYLSEAEKGCERARDLVKQFITFSRGEDLDKGPVSISELLQDVCASIPTDPTVRCEISLPEELWQIEIDKKLMREAINGIINNAREAMPEGGVITIAAKNMPLETGEIAPDFPGQSGRFIQISVQDQGIGISEEILDKVFDPYFSTKERGVQKGMGLGLAIIHSIAKMHEGYIEITSQTGTGTTAHIFLPANA